MDAELSEIGCDPFSPKFFGNCRSCARTNEEITYQITFVAARFDDAF